MTRVVTLEDALEIVKQLSPLDKVRLIEKVTPDIKQQLVVTTHQPRKSLRGLWRGANISDAVTCQASRATKRCGMLLVC